MIGSILNVRCAPPTSSSLDISGLVHVKFLGLEQKRHDRKNNRCANLESKRSFRNLQSSSRYGAQLELAAVKGRDLRSRPVIRNGGCARAQRPGGGGGEDDVKSPLPSRHIIKSASASSFEQLFGHARSNRYTNFKSSIVVLGLSVHTAPLSMREKLAVPEAEWPRAISELCEHNHIEEAAVLSTCNRLEIYVVALSWNLGVQEVVQWMSETSGIRVQDLREHLFILRDRDASQHLFKVSSGLDSLVLGEGQILSQVKQVHKVGQTVAPKFGRNLNGLFKQAITAGKRVRSETNISSGAVSISSAAVELAVMKLPQQQQAICSADILIVGAGKMSKLLVRHLIAKGCSKIVMVNRTEQRVSDLQADSPDVELVYRPLSELMNCAGEADIIFTSTASEAPLFSKEQVEKLPVPSGVSSRVRHFIDISVPRNVSPRVAEIESTMVYNVDDLREVVEANKDERRRKALEAQVIIEEDLQSFEAWRDSLETVPTIKKLRAYAENVRASELEKCLGKMGDDVTKKDRRLLEDLTRGIVNKLLHGPMQHLRCDGADSRTVGETLQNMHALERMFDLKTDLAALEKRLEAAAAEKIKQ